MKHGLRRIIILALLPVVSPALCLAQLCTTPSNNQGFGWYPIGLQPNACEVATEKHGYYITPFAGVLCTVEQFDSWMLQSPGIVDIFTHGRRSPDVGFYLENVGTEQAALNRVSALCGPGKPFQAGELYAGQLPSGTWGVGVYHTAIQRKYRVSNGIVTLMACRQENAPVWPGARGMARVICCDVTGNKLASAETTIWGSLNGANGIPERVLDEVRDDVEADSVVLVGDCLVTLAPAIAAVSVESGTAYNCPQDADIEVTFISDTELDTGGDAEVAVAVDGTAFTCSSAEWFGANGLRVWLTPHCDDPGSVEIDLNHQYIHSDSLTTAALDGDGKDGPDDYRHGLTLTDNPSVVVDGLHAGPDSVTWNATAEHDVDHYLLRGRTQPNEPWQSATGALPPGAGLHSVPRPTGFPILGLFERDAAGEEIFYGEAAQDPLGPGADTTRPTLAVLDSTVAALASQTPPPEWNPNRDGTYGEKIGIYTPAEFGDEIQYLADWLAGWFGIEATIVLVEQFGAPENRFPGILASIRTLETSGVHYFLLVGDASDWRYFDGPLTTQYWPSNWEIRRQQYFFQGYPHGGDPLRNVIPAAVVPDTSYWRNMARYQPYYFLGDDFAYGNTDEDELQLPDVAVGRWPFADPEDVLVAIHKLMHYMSYGYSGSSFNVGLFAGDISYNYYGEGAVVRAMASRVADALQPVGYVQTLRAADWPDPDTRREAALALWRYPTELAVMVSTRASRYNAADFFDMPNFNINMLQDNSWTSIVIGASCGMGEFARTEDPCPNYQRPLMQRFLAAYEKGAVGWCGPSAGTWQLGNDAVATTIAEYISADPTRPTGESVRLALRDIVENADPVRDAAIVKTARSYGYFGFPLSGPETTVRIGGKGGGAC